MPATHRGGCHCGAVRYQFAGELSDIARCHCSVCRRSTGGIVTTQDHPKRAPANRHLWVQSRLPWIHLDPDLPEEQQELIE